METETKPIICVSICEPDIDAIEQAMSEAGAIADLLEIRLDCLSQSQIHKSFKGLDHLLAKSPRPTILTYRSAKQGGKQADDENRLSFWVFNRPSAEVFLDMELDLASAPTLFDYVKAPDWSRVICSHHDFIGMPADLESLYQRMANTPARILKIAVQADDAIDCLPLLRLLERARAEGREMIAIAMGDAGLMTRILGSSRGAFLTYASREKEKATAPGQLTARELRDVYRIGKINQQTEIFGLVGSPVSHSLSPRLHNAAFDTADVNAVYIPFEVRDLPAFIRRMVDPRTREIDWKLRGLSVTAPHKIAVMRHLDWIEPTAREIGAVNTILIDEHGLCGYNTDASGFIRPLVERLGSLRGLRVAIIGTGGVASAAVWSLKNQGAAVTIVGRTPERVGLLAKRFDVESCDLRNAQFDSFDVVVNATTLGTSGRFQHESPADATRLRGARLAYDLVYNPRETEFLRQALVAGCQTIAGIEMFVAQAEDQFRFWTGADAVAGVMRTAAERTLK